MSSHWVCPGVQMIAALMLAAALSGAGLAVVEAPQESYSGHALQRNSLDCRRIVRPFAEWARDPEGMCALADAFARIKQTMGQEMRNAISAAGADTDRRKADLDAIEASYKAQVDAFGTRFAAWFDREGSDGAMYGSAYVAAFIREEHARIPTIRAQLEAEASANAR